MTSLSGLVACTDSSQDTFTSETSAGQTPDSSPSICVASAGKVVHVSEVSPSAATSFLPHQQYQQQQQQKRRSSSRSIKRKKFDDELVESSFFKSGSGGGGGNANRRSGDMCDSFTVSGSRDVSTPVTPLPLPPPASLDKKKGSKSTPKRLKKNKPKDTARWKATDDLALITAVQQTSDLEVVHRGAKFSHAFTLMEIQERWYSLLYDATVSKAAVYAMKQLNPEMVVQIQARALFSQAEEELLAQMPSSGPVSLETFQALLDKHPSVFLPLRTPKSLWHQWHLMKQYYLLPDQTVPSCSAKGDPVHNFSDIEELLSQQTETKESESVENELNLCDRKSKREIRKLEAELPKWQVMVDTITGVSPSEIDNQTLAVLRGRLVRYLMRSKEISIGRSSKTGRTDVDLSLEGPAWKISRRQGTIRLRSLTGEFFIFNEGKRSFFVDGKPLLTGHKTKLNHNAIVELHPMIHKRWTGDLGHTISIYKASEPKPLFWNVHVQSVYMGLQP